MICSSENLLRFIVCPSSGQTLIARGGKSGGHVTSCRLGARSDQAAFGAATNVFAVRSADHSFGRFAPNARH
jgi:hypothetical protein